MTCLPSHHDPLVVSSTLKSRSWHRPRRSNMLDPCMKIVYSHLGYISCPLHELWFVKLHSENSCKLNMFDLRANIQFRLTWVKWWLVVRPEKMATNQLCAVRSSFSMFVNVTQLVAVVVWSQNGKKPDWTRPSNTNAMLAFSVLFQNHRLQSHFETWTNTTPLELGHDMQSNGPAVTHTLVCCIQLHVWIC